MTQGKKTSCSLTPIIPHRASVSYPARNLLAEQEKSPLNQTFAMGQRMPLPLKRSNSIDSDVVEYTIQDAIAGRLPQPRSGKSSKSWTNRSVRDKSTSLSRVFSSNLPSLEGYAPNRTCCQKIWTQTQNELQKYKRALLSK
ncbi:hypothetical protein QR680_006891 [Steinernema hermaphroditum]|uniref:Uncharacterized protein n=1 Tax=Steinernema hermaphroditum TaxID=289476 RepID=A0AA39HYC0_9BILA|nr:hypothetical protein QR680_006891 [Steinernema hermaphroditum]